MFEYRVSFITYKFQTYYKDTKSFSNFQTFFQNVLVVSGFIPNWIGHTFGFIRCWLQPLSHFVVTNIRKHFHIS